jgi:hypothetical protein
MKGDQPPDDAHAGKLGPFIYHACGECKLPTNILNLLEMIYMYYYSPTLLKLLETMPMRKRTNQPSLRLIEWLLTIESYNKPLFATSDDGSVNDIYGMYLEMSTFFGHTKHTFDPNRRVLAEQIYHRIWFRSLTTNELQFSTVAAAHFLIFVYQNNIIKFARQNSCWISRNLKNELKKRSKARTEASQKGVKLKRQSFRKKQTI